MDCGDNGFGIIYVYRSTTKAEGDKKKIYLHRALLRAVEGELVDHINRDPLDNRRSNLRIASRKVSSINRGKNKTWRGRPTSSKFKGVSWNKKQKKWQSYVCCDTKVKHLGFFTEEIDAARAYDEMAYELYGDYAYLNYETLVNTSMYHTDDVESVSSHSIV